MAQPLEFFLFRSYSKAIKDWLTETCYLSRYPKDENVLVVYATPGKAFAKYIYPVINGQQFRPTISFHLSGMEYGQTENNLGHVKDRKFDSTNDTYIISKPLLAYKLTFSTTIRTILASDADIILYQLLTNASFNAKASFMLDGQWVEIGAGNPRDETTLEPGDAQDRIIRFGIDLTVPRAYLPREYKDNVGVIEQINLTYEAVPEVYEGDYI